MRNVYFDPFGQYTAGYDTGSQREAQQQGQIRDARVADFNYNYEKPLELNALQRADQLGAFALPYQKNAVSYADQLGRNNVYKDQQGINQDTARMFGFTAPLENTTYSYYGITPHLGQYVTPPENPNLTAAKQHYAQNLAASTEAGGLPATPELRRSIAQQMASHFNVSPDDILSPIQAPQIPQPQYNYTMQGPDGQPVNIGSMVDPHGALLNYLNRDAAMKEALLRFNMSKDVYGAQQDQVRNQQQQDWMDIQRGYRNATGTDPASGLWAP